MFSVVGTLRKADTEVKRQITVLTKRFIVLFGVTRAGQLTFTMFCALGKVLLQLSAPGFIAPHQRFASRWPQRIFLLPVHAQQIGINYIIFEHMIGRHAALSLRISKYYRRHWAQE